MSHRKHMIRGALILAALSASTTAALGQWSLDGNAPDGRTPRNNWEQRAVRGYRGAAAGTPLQSSGDVQQPVMQQPDMGQSMMQQPAMEQEYAASPAPNQGMRRVPNRMPARTARNPRANGAVLTGYNVESSAAASGAQGGLEPIPEGEVVSGGMGQDANAAMAASYGGGCGGGACGYGGGCGDDCGCDSCGDCEWGCGDPCGGYLFRNLSIFAGAHAFKGPVDLGRNGNFGLQEGLNFGAPLGDPWCTGFQLGFGAAQSNFSGDQVDDSRSGDRDQLFFTGGLFHRATCGGLQWGVVYDLQHDVYYNRTDLKQIRSETSIVLPWGNEIGYFGAYGTGGDNLILLDRTKLGLEPTDMFCLFFRRHFESGGEGRVWGGASGNGDGLLGADFNVPLGKGFALENRFNYLIPKDGPRSGGQSREAWGLVMQIVWYPGRHAACETNNPFRPLFNVADNSTFMVSRTGYESLSQ